MEIKVLGARDLDAVYRTYDTVLADSVYFNSKTRRICVVDFDRAVEISLAKNSHKKFFNPKPKKERP